MFLQVGLLMTNDYSGLIYSSLALAVLTTKSNESLNSMLRRRLVVHDMRQPSGSCLSLALAVLTTNKYFRIEY